MKIIVTTQDGTVYPLDVGDELPLRDLKALLEAEVGIESQTMLVIHNMRPLNKDEDSLSALGVKDGDILLIASQGPSGNQTVAPVNPQSQSQTVSNLQSHTSVPPQVPPQIADIDWESIQVPSSLLSSSNSARPQTQPGAQPQTQNQPQNPEHKSIDSFVQHFLSNPEELAMIQQRHPELAEAIMSGDYKWITQAITQYRHLIMEEERQRTQLAGLDPWSEEYQQRLAENIRQRNIQENMETALEHNPEIFMGRVHMLYIVCRVNGQPVKALVDSGAQMTVMNVSCAQRCDIMRLVDRRYASYAFGVGRQKIIGVIHLGQIEIGGDFLASSFRVLEDQSHELILGLDMMKRHQCCIDLERGVLRIGTTKRETEFLSETDIPQATYEIENKGIMADEDREMASAIANSEKEINNERTPPQDNTPRSSQAMATDDVKVTEEAIKDVMSAGFDRKSAVEELIRFKGDPVQAKASLFAKLLPQ